MISTDILIVGAGFSGLCMGARLRRAGIEDFLVIEKADAVGGTWRDNRYPGCACDIPAELYSLSFAPSQGWSRDYPQAPELFAYLQDVVRRFGLDKYLCLSTSMEEARWDAQAAQWRVRTSAGELSARVMVGAIGALHVPKYPDIAGAAAFAGQAFHTARWPENLDLAGKRVAVIGTGASAVQAIPEIAKTAAHVTVFQRTPPWVLPKANAPVGPARRAIRRIPAARRALRAAQYWQHEMRVAAFLRPGKLLRAAEAGAIKHLRSQVADPALRDALTPHYRMGCKRVLISNDYFPAIGQPHATLITAPIDRIEPSGVVSAGALHPADILVYGTGFDTRDALTRLPIFGRDGISLGQAWAERVTSWRGIGVAGFPNLFLLLGPNTGLGHNSVVLMIEAQVAHVLSAIRQMRAKGVAAMEPSPAAQGRWASTLAARLPGTVWQAGGCESWYKTASGENFTIWPGNVRDYVRGTRRADLADYVTQPEPAPAA